MQQKNCYNVKFASNVISISAEINQAILKRMTYVVSNYFLEVGYL